MTNNKKWKCFCSVWMAIGSTATVDANRRIAAAGYEATMRMLGGAA